MLEMDSTYISSFQLLLVLLIKQTAGDTLVSLAGVFPSPLTSTCSRYPETRGLIRDGFRILPLMIFSTIALSFDPA